MPPANTSAKLLSRPCWNDKLPVLQMAYTHYLLVIGEQGILTVDESFSVVSFNSLEAARVPETEIAV